MICEIIIWLIGGIVGIICGLIFTYYEEKEITVFDIILWGVGGTILSWFTILVILFLKIMFYLENKYKNKVVFKKKEKRT